MTAADRGRYPSHDGGTVSTGLARHLSIKGAGMEGREGRTWEQGWRRRRWRWRLPADRVWTR